MWLTSNFIFGEGGGVWMISGMIHSHTLILGDMGVGKSCLLHQFTEKKCI